MTTAATGSWPECTASRLIVTSRTADCLEICRPDVQAVIYAPLSLEPWFDDLSEAVALGSVRIRRVITTYLSLSELVAVARRELARSELPAAAGHALLADVSALAEGCRGVTRGERFQLRLMAPTPDLRHGFHIDLTDQPQARRVLRIYGAGTEYVEPEDVISWIDFFTYVHQREHVAKRLVTTSGAERDHCLAWLDRLDRRPPFLRAGAVIRSVPRGGTVVIEAVPRDRLRPYEVMRGRANGWIHRSPANGAPRLVVSVTSG